MLVSERGLLFAGYLVFFLGSASPLSAQASFPERPAHARLQTMDGVLTSYGIGNDSGTLEIEDDHGQTISFTTGGVKIDGRSYDCEQAPEDGQPLRVSPDCKQWPRNVRLGQTRVRVVYWHDREPITDSQTGKPVGYHAILATDEIHALPPRTCFFWTEDRSPPSVIRQGPSVSSAAITSLPNHSVVVPVVAHDGWMKLKAPRPGWLAFGLVRFSCGTYTNITPEAATVVSNWSKAGATGDLAAATQLGWAIASRSLDGGLADEADDGFSNVMLRRPNVAIQVIEGLPPRVALEFLTDEMDGVDPPVRKTFELALRDPANATSLARRLWPQVLHDLATRKRVRG